MSKYSTKIAIWNKTRTPRVFYVEPCGNDYTLLPREKAELWIFSETELPSFEIVENDKCTSIFCMADFKMMQGDRELECGHNRDSDDDPVNPPASNPDAPSESN